MERSLVPSSYPIMKSPVTPAFAGIGTSQTTTQGYVVLPIYLPNVAAMNGSKNGQVVKINVEFQVVERCLAGFLLGIDAMRGYKMVIDTARGHISFETFSPPIRVPIVGSTRYEREKYDPRIFSTETISLKPYSESWVPIRFKPPPGTTKGFFVTPIRHIHHVEGTYASASYAVMSDRTNHVLVINPTSHPVRMGADSVIGTFEPMPKNTPFSYFSSIKKNIGKVAKAAMVAAVIAPAFGNSATAISKAPPFGHDVEAAASVPSSLPTPSSLTDFESARVSFMEHPPNAFASTPPTTSTVGPNN